uniref:Uncharacterized protein n=1 Tax=Rhizophora mucronata TaxID=61149 RepID=A0A2P2R4W5_RHIMU
MLKHYTDGMQSKSHQAKNMTNS